MIRHVVKKGDTLTLIAEKYGVSIDSIVKANNIKDPDLIIIGQIILIPKSDKEPSPPRPPRPPAPPKRPSITRAYDGIQYTLTLNKAKYKMGERIVIMLKKKNILSVPLTLTYRSSQKVDFRVMQNKVHIWQWSRKKAFTQAINKDKFDPGEEKVYKIVWNQRTDHKLIRPGKYTITGWNLATPSIRLSLDFEIE